MLGYLYLFLALTGGLIKGFTGKKISHDVHTLKDCLFVNFLRFLFCALISFGFLLAAPGGFALPTLHELPFYLFSAVCMAAFCIVYMFGYQTAAYMYLSIFGMLGSVLTGVLGNMIYQEPLNSGKWAGMAFLICAVVVMAKYNKAITMKETGRTLPLLILAAVSAALSDFSQKIFVNEIGGSAAAYNFYTYSFAALLLLLLSCSKGGWHAVSVPLLNGRHILLCLVISAALFMNSYSKTLAAAHLTAAEIYPVLQGANLIASAVLAQILLKERMTLRSVAGMLCAFIGLMIMSFC